MIVSDKDPHLAGLIYFIDRAKEIAVFTNTVFDSIAEIAAGIVSSIVRNFPSGSHRTKLHYAWPRYAEESLS